VAEARDQFGTHRKGSSEAVTGILVRRELIENS
jgi:hypothetical protein